MSDAAADTATPLADDRAPPAATDRADPRLVGWWLVVMAGLVWLMVVVGGATRLTESGLSMVDWQPIRGVVPPLTEAQWLEEFEAYRQYPEYRLLNRGMSLEAFKTIFWWEYAHRLLGRLIGLAFAIPLAVFWLRGIIPPGCKPRLVGLFLLGGAQGLLGWFMVKSGLVDEPEVSHYRLTAHLTLAFAIFAALMWTALSLLRPRAGPSDPLLRRLAGLFVGLVFLQVILGGLVAGLKAGYAFNSWPLMDGRLIPAHLFDMSPWWRNLVDSTITTQFNHRLGAYVLTVLAVLLPVLAWRRRAPAPVRTAAAAVLATVVLQMVLGILTLINEVPVGLGTLHQGGGILALAAALYLAHGLRGERQAHADRHRHPVHDGGQ